MVLARILFLACLLLPASLIVQAGDPLQKSAVESELAPRNTGNLAVAIVVSDKPDYLKQLMAPPDPAHPFELVKLKKAKPGQKLYISFLVTGIYLGLREEFDYKVSFYVHGPDGKPVFGQRNFASGHGKHPKKPAIYLAEPILQLTFGPEHPPGTYRIVARVEDQTNGQRAKNSYTFTLEGKKAK